MHIHTNCASGFWERPALNHTNALLQSKQNRTEGTSCNSLANYVLSEQILWPILKYELLSEHIIIFKCNNQLCVTSQRPCEQSEMFGVERI